MLLKMIPSAISAAWDGLSYHIEQALPDSERTDQTMNNLLQLLLLEQASCWVSYDSQNDNKVNFVIVLVPVINGIAGEKNLLIYAITNNASIDLKTSNRMWLEGFAALKKYMLANGFKRLVSYFDDDNHRSFKLAKRFGAKVSHYMELDMEG